MRNIAVVSVPILMFLDYFLTLAGKKLRDKVYSQHFANEEYELNPGWQKDINKFKLFNYKHILLVILVTVYFYFTEKLAGEELFFFIYGIITGVYVYIIMKHVQNILIFNYTNTNPHLLNGTVLISHLIGLKIAQYSALTTAIFTFFLFFFTDSVFILGNTAGLFLLWLIHNGWIIRYKKKIAKVVF